MDIAGWVAPTATMIAAMMTAANLGSRVTGWGFVVFLIGAIAWSIVAIATGQQNLLWSNVFLGLVDIVGIWRWLGRKAKLDDGAEKALDASASANAPTLFPIGMIEGGAIKDGTGTPVAQCVGAMAERESGRLSYLVVQEGGVAGVGSRHLAVPWSWLEVADDSFLISRNHDLATLDPIDPGHWPAAATG